MTICLISRHGHHAVIDEILKDREARFDRRRERVFLGDGVNRFQAEEKQANPTLRMDPEIERSQVARLNALRTRRDGAKSRVALEEVERRARAADNLVPAILAAVEAYATVGEISDALRRAFGEYRESVVI